MSCQGDRLRMVLLYAQAETQNLLVAGCADVMPIRHLYRSQVEALAAYLGVPEAIRTKRADPDVMPGVDDKEALLGGFRVADEILWALEHTLPRSEIVAHLSEPQVQRIEQLVAAARHLAETPYTLASQDTASRSSERPPRQSI